MAFSSCLKDDSFGPAIEGCRDDFDFTIKFEKIFFMLIPTSIFIAACLPRFLYLVGKSTVVRGCNHLRAGKLMAISFYGMLQLTMLVLVLVEPRSAKPFFVASSAMTFASTLFLGVLSYFEHSRSARPSIMLSAYLSLTILLDVAQIRTLWLASSTPDDIVFSRLFTTGLVVKALLIILESRNKIKWLVWDAKAHSPEESSGLYSLGVFAWLNKLFVSGYTKVLVIDDLYPLDHGMTSATLQAKLVESVTTVSSLRKHGLARATARALAIPLLLPVCPRIALTAFQFAQPFLINTLLTYLESPSGRTSRNHGYGLIGAAFLIYTGIALSGAIYWYLQERAMYMMRGVLAGVVYRKTIEAQLSAVDDSAALTLMSADVERIIRGLLSLHELWANAVEVALACWLLSRQIGASFVAPLVVVACCVLLSAVLARFSGPRQKIWMEKIEKRVGLTSNILGQMKYLKISGMVGPVEDLVQQMRIDELKMGSRFRWVLVWSVVIGYLPVCISPVVTYAFAGKTLDVTTIFVTMSYLLLLANPLAILFQMIPGFNAAYTCFSRIQSFLDQSSQVDFRKVVPMNSSESRAGKAFTSENRAPQLTSVLTIVDGNFGWDENKMSLHDINLQIPASGLTIVLGPIASGKSTLCHVILSEVPFVSGKVMIASLLGKIGFCDQTPYLANTTIRQNIIGYSDFDETRYNEVLVAAMLLSDLADLPQGDQTNVGSTGITLSGGQKSRVSIARALYLESQVLLFDDVLSGLDTDTEDQVFLRTFSPNGLLKRRAATAVLCTHSVKHLLLADHIIALGTDGRIVEQGTFRELMTHRDGYVFSLGIKEVASSLPGKTIPPTSPSIASTSQQPQYPTSAPAVFTSKESTRRTLGDGTAFRHYLARLNAWHIVAVVVLALAWGFFSNFNIIWLKFWSEDVTADQPTHSNAFYIGLYALFQVLRLLALFSVCLVALVASISVSGARIHKEALATIINAPLKFFTTTDTGVVINLFSQDMTLIDGSLPMSSLNTTVVIADCLGVAAVIATSSRYLIITYPFLAAILWGIQRFYLRTSRQIRLLDLEAKSPLYTHFMDTMKGLATFRAYGWSTDGIALNDTLLDTSQRPAYLLAMIQRWLSLVLQLVVAGLAVIFVTLATQLRSNTAFTGASLITLMSFGDMLSLLVEQYTMLETSIGAISRLKTFSDEVVSETKVTEDVIPRREWPAQGHIEILGVSASYHDVDNESLGEIGGVSGTSTPKALAINNLTLSISPGEKVAICGSSGSGKSSTILLLLKILNPLSSTGHNIIIDGIPLHKIDRQTLRQRIIAVPQDPVFLPNGTSFKANLDPYTASNASECRTVIETVGLWPFILERGGLEAGMSSDTLSAGQKQLFSLARAVLRARIRARERVDAFGEKGIGSTPGGILLLDEVSSSVDQETDKAMHEVIRKEFEGYTVVMVSHRLDVVMDFDTVVVMERGKVVEKGRPRELAELEGGRFRKLWLVGHS